MRTDRMTSVLADAEETLYEYLETHCEEFHNESEDWQETLDEVDNFECQDWIHEIADSSVPVYTYNIMECAANIYERVCNHLYEVEQKLKRKVVDNHKTKESKDGKNNNA